MPARTDAVELGRILYALPRSTLGHRAINPPPLSASTATAWRQLLRGLLELRRQIDGEGCQKERCFELSAAALQQHLAFEGAIEPELGDSGKLYIIGDWAAKLAGAVARIAGILHAVRCMSSSILPWEEPIGETTMSAAIEIGRYLIPHASAAYSLMGEDPVIEDARHVLRWIQREGCMPFTARDAHQALRSSLKSADRVAKALDVLTEHGYVRALKATIRTGPGRPSSQRYEVNPHTQNTQKGDERRV